MIAIAVSPDFRSLRASEALVSIGLPDIAATSLLHRAVQQERWVGIRERVAREKRRPVPGQGLRASTT